jgi:ribosomal protein L29
MADNIKKIKDKKSEILILKKSLMNLKFQKSSGQLEKTSEIKIVRVKIARLKTEISKIHGENNA